MENKCYMEKRKVIFLRVRPKHNCSSDFWKEDSQMERRFTSLFLENCYKKSLQILFFKIVISNLIKKTKIKIKN